MTTELVQIWPGVVDGARGRMRVLVVGIPDISDDDRFFPEGMNEARVFRRGRWLRSAGGDRPRV